MNHVEDPTVKDIMDFKTGEVISSVEYLKLKDTDNKKIGVRRKLQLAKRSNEKWLVCVFCNDFLHLSGGGEGGYKRLHFAHSTQNISCPAKKNTIRNPKDIMRDKFLGQRESLAHKELKEYIAEKLRKSSFQKIMVEKRFCSIEDHMKYKQPDVSATCPEGKQMVFEIQLSTTFNSVIVEREEFYKENQTFIIWFFGEFKPDQFCQMDIYHSNKTNAFVIDEFTRKESEEKRIFCFWCYYLEYQSDGSDIQRQVLITFEDLKVDPEDYKLFYFDYDSMKQKIKWEQRWKDNESFKDKWIELLELGQENEKIYKQLIKESIGKTCPERWDFRKFYKIFNVFLSFQRRAIYGSKLTNFLAVTNNFLTHYGEYVFEFEALVEYHGYYNALSKKGSFLSKLEEAKSKACNSGEFHKTLKYFFPEITT